MHSWRRRMKTAVLSDIDKVLDDLEEIADSHTIEGFEAEYGHLVLSIQIAKDRLKCLIENSRH